MTNITVTHSINLNDADFATLGLSGSVWPTNGRDGAVFLMRGLNYRYVSADTEKSRSHDALLQFVSQAAYTSDIYQSLEAFFSRQGYSANANRAFIAGKRRERQEFFEHKQYLSWLNACLLDLLVGYGRHPSQAGYFCAFLVALGLVVFAPDKMEQQDPQGPPRIYNRFWYSLGLFLPVVNLESDKVWKPKADQTFLRNYVRVHILLGWILIPIFLAALTGLIK